MAATAPPSLLDPVEQPSRRLFEVVSEASMNHDPAHGSTVEVMPDS
jgi:hypothetical protein